MITGAAAIAVVINGGISIRDHTQMIQPPAVHIWIRIVHFINL